MTEAARTLGVLVEVGLKKKNYYLTFADSRDLKLGPPTVVYI